MHRHLLLATSLPGLIGGAALAQGVWVPARGMPAATVSASLPYDLARQRAVFVGTDFETSSGPFGMQASRTRTLEWDGAHWSDRTSGTGPGPRSSASVGYDLARRRTVLFGGGHPLFVVPCNDETWEWDGATWTQRLPAVRPSPRFGAGMTCDELRQRIVLFGGSDGVSLLGDTWEWDGAAWTQRIVVGPGPRSGAGMTFDAARQVVVLHGGRDAGGPRDDTWMFFGTTWALAANTVRPPAGATPIAYDRARQRVVLPFAGAQTWEWDGVDWQGVAAHPFATGRLGASVGYDAGAGLVLVAAGQENTTGAPYRSDLWGFDGVAWQQLDPDAAANFDGYAAAAYDRQRRTAVVLTYRLDAVQEGAGVFWRRRAAAASPPQRGGLAVAYDEARGRTVLFGGLQLGPPPWSLFGDTWEWDGTNWQQHLPAAAPPPRQKHAMSYDAAGGGVLLFGGEGAGGNLDDSWRFDGVQWQQLQPAGRPAPRKGHAMATDRVRQRVVLFGGGDDQTWEWDGGNWTQALPPVRPPARAFAGLAFDENGARTVLFGGRDPADIPLADTWLWDGVAWTPVPGAGTAVALPVLVYDGALDRVLLLEGISARMLARTPAAGTQAVGQGCHGTGSGLLLRSDDPYLGNAASAFELQSPFPGAACLFAFATSSALVPLGGGCTLHVASGGARFGLTNVLGVARAALPVPPAPALRGLTLFAQAAMLDPLGPLGGLALSAGLQLTVGD